MPYADSEVKKAYDRARDYRTPDRRMKTNRTQRLRRLRASIEIKTRQLKEMFDEEEI